MNTNPVRAAVDLVDTEPSREFLSALRARLLADDNKGAVALILGQAANAATATDQQPINDGSETVEEYVMLEPNITSAGRQQRGYKLLLAAAVCVAALAAVLVINRSNDPQADDEFRDVDPKEALPLGQAAMITADKLGAGWQTVGDFTLKDYAEQTAAINAAMPACAQLASVGLTQPTNKSVIVHQDFANGPVPMFHDVWVFATPQAASLAMDAIAGDVYPTCFFNLFDRLTALNRNVTAVSTSTAWLAPEIAPHGDRQVIIGQKINYTLPDGFASVEAINAYVQVGRAIAFIDPQYLSDVSAGSNVETAIAASTNALKTVFGQ